ncbi:hypothetical protein HCN51_45770, partial [Nonomuraea sp. FMUSA5-5]|nr:hypothetical protein [Nonomuraea sp. FMUSA5-5]
MLAHTTAGVVISDRHDLRVAQLYSKNKALCFNLDPLLGRGQEELAEAC